MAKINIDLNTNPEVKDLVADKEPGDVIMLRTTIKSKDDQTLTLTLDEATEGESDDMEDDDSEDTEDHENSESVDERINEGEEMAPPEPPHDRTNY